MLLFEILISFVTMTDSSVGICMWIDLHALCYIFQRGYVLIGKQMNVNIVRVSI